MSSSPVASLRNESACVQPRNDGRTRLSRLLRRLPIGYNSMAVACINMVLVLAGHAEGSGESSLTVRYERAARTWNRSALEEIAKSGKNRTGRPEILTAARAFWKLQVFAMMENDRSGIEQYGKEALKLLDRLDNGSEEREIHIIRAFVYQLLASTSMMNGATYGVRSAGEIDWLKQNYPDTFYTRLLASINRLEAPGFAGGDPEKATNALDSLYSAYPDSSLAGIHFARGLMRTGRTNQSEEVITQILKREPQNALARSVLNDIRSKKDD